MLAFREWDDDASMTLGEPSMGGWGEPKIATAPKVVFNGPVGTLASEAFLKLVHELEAGQNEGEENTERETAKPEVS